MTCTPYHRAFAPAPNPSSVSNRYSKSLPADKAAGRLREKKARYDYGLGLVVVVVVVSVLLSVAGVLAGTVVVVLVSLVFSVVAGGFTTVVLVSVFFSAGEAGATVSVFCSHAPRSAALARMQINFFIVVIGCPSWD
jgi:Na+(H+)/acetate symporter ActP